jgi:hypothetical protein
MPIARIPHQIVAHHSTIATHSLGLCSTCRLHCQAGSQQTVCGAASVRYKTARRRRHAVVTGASARQRTHSRDSKRARFVVNEDRGCALAGVRRRPTVCHNRCCRWSRSVGRFCFVVAIVQKTREFRDSANILFIRASSPHNGHAVCTRH